MCNYRCMGAKDAPATHTDYEYIVPQTPPNYSLPIDKTKPFISVQPKEETTFNTTVGYFLENNRFIPITGNYPFARVPEEPRIGDFLGIDNQPIKINTDNRAKRIFKIDDKYTQLLNELVEFTSLIDDDCDASEIWTSLGTLLQRHGRAAKLNEIYLEDDDDE